jgi:starch-binding outer membrane protein, SusD/RagB family
MKNYSTILFSVCLLFVGCKFFETTTPNAQVLTAKVFSNAQTANAALGSIIGKLNDDPYISSYHLALFTGLCSDELSTVTIPVLDEMYINKINPQTNIYINGYWKNMYNLIYAANNAYEQCSVSKGLSVPIKKELMAEALFIRAYIYFYLVNLYGPVPLALTTNPEVNRKLFRSPIDTVYKSIISDLNFARTELNEYYVGVDGLTSTEDRFRPNSNTAIALLARVYLYRGKFEDAEMMASLIINNPDYSLASIDSVFLKGNRETIWQLNSNEHNDYNINTWEGNKFILTASPLLTGQQTISSTLLGGFDTRDLRRRNWIGVFSTFYYPFKYKVQKGSRDQKEASVVFRLAEQYLIRAEARAQLGKLSEGLTDLNVIRVRAGIAPLSGLNREQLLTAILKERQKELFVEQGHRWLDLKRTGQVGPVCMRKSPSWNPFMERWPIPPSDILNNGNLVQNEGY